MYCVLCILYNMKSNRKKFIWVTQPGLLLPKREGLPYMGSPPHPIISFYISHVYFIFYNIEIFRFCVFKIYFIFHQLYFFQKWCCLIWMSPNYLFLYLIRHSYIPCFIFLCNSKDLFHFSKIWHFLYFHLLLLKMRCF